MKTIITVLREEVNYLEKIIQQTRLRLKKAPRGFLRIAKKRHRMEYYYKDSETSHNGRYMPKKEIDLARKLVQRDYDERLINVAESRIKVINDFLSRYEETSLTEVYHKTNAYRKELLIMHEVSDEEYIKEWQSVEYEGKPFVVDSQEIITERGEQVRSKSEKIIADKLYSLGIPYRYEYPLLLDGNSKVYPDFTILKMPEKEEVYLEHFGMMDDAEYVEKALFKLSTYERNEIFLGVNLFITCETGKRSLNMRALDKMLRKIFCDEGI